MEGRFAIGPAWILSRRNDTGTGGGLSLEDAFERESRRLKAFIEGSPVPEVFSAHLEMLEDQMLRDTIRRNMLEGMTARSAVEAAAQEISELFYGTDDEYLRARVDDVRDVCQGLVDCLSGACGDPFEGLPEGAVVVAEELFPSDTARMDLGRVKAFVTARGSKTSHVSIIARNRGIPCVTGADISGIRDGDLLMVDGEDGSVLVNPTGQEAVAFRERMASGNALPEGIIKLVKDSKTTIYANAGSVRDVEGAIRAGAGGIGLFRTEFLFIGSGSLPTEEEQYLLYRQAVEACQGRPLTIRTMDIGGDKPAPCLDLPKEDNPFLGMRGLRLSLSMPDLFKDQVRAILRASAFGKVRMMLPMVTRVEELLEAKALVEECKAGLKAQGIPFDDALEIGIMIETPAAVFISDRLAAEARFFSIGTNDLTQYVMAADRGNASVSYLCDPLDDAVVRALGMVVESAHRAGIPVGVCGEAASDPEAIELFCKLGIDSLSLGSSDLIKELKA